jgi:2,3-bisphosphoglycerate-dependent phosphoglycerate mutase
MIARDAHVPVMRTHAKRLSTSHTGRVRRPEAEPIQPRWLDGTKSDRSAKVNQARRAGLFSLRVPTERVTANRPMPCSRSGRTMLPMTHVAVPIPVGTRPLRSVREAPVAGDDRVSSSYRLVLLRHGESEWNERGLFTGWTDVDLSERGELEAAQAGELLRRHNVLPDVVHTSVLLRAIRTADLALLSAKRHWIPVRRSWRLNERHYGALQGKNKEETRAEFGSEQYLLWRRSFDIPPPEDLATDLARDPRYRNLARELLPGSECLKDVLARVLPYWHDAIVPDLRVGLTVLVAAHGNSLRALVKHLDSIGDDEIAGLNLPTGVPLVYELDQNLRPIRALDPGFGVSGTYLDEEAAATSIGRVSAQGLRT